MDDAEAALIITQNLVKLGYTPDDAVAAMNAVADGSFQTAEDYFAANNITPKAPALKGGATPHSVVPPGPTYGGYLNLQYAYKYLVSMGESPSNADEYVTSMATLAGLTRDARTYIGSGSHPRRLMNVGAARLPA